MADLDAETPPVDEEVRSASVDNESSVTSADDNDSGTTELVIDSGNTAVTSVGDNDSGTTELVIDSGNTAVTSVGDNDSGTTELVIDSGNTAGTSVGNNDSGTTELVIDSGNTAGTSVGNNDSGTTELVIDSGNTAVTSVGDNDSATTELVIGFGNTAGTPGDNEEYRTATPENNSGNTAVSSVDNKESLTSARENNYGNTLDDNVSATALLENESRNTAVTLDDNVSATALLENESRNTAVTSMENVSCTDTVDSVPPTTTAVNEDEDSTMRIIKLEPMQSETVNITDVDYEPNDKEQNQNGAFQELTENGELIHSSMHVKLQDETHFNLESMNPNVASQKVEHQNYQITNIKSQMKDTMTSEFDYADNWQSNIEIRSNVLANAWNDLYSLLGEYKAELCSKDTTVQKYEGISDTQHLKNELADKECRIRTLEDELARLKGLSEQREMNLSVKDSLLKKYQEDLLQKEAALVTASTKTTRLENRLKMLEANASNQIGESPPRKLARTQYSPVRTQFSPNRSQPSPNRSQFSPNRNQFSPNRSQFPPNRSQFSPNRSPFSPGRLPGMGTMRGAGRTFTSSIGRGHPPAGRYTPIAPKRRLYTTNPMDQSLQSPMKPLNTMPTPNPTEEEPIVCIELNDDDDEVQVVKEAAEAGLDDGAFMDHSVFPDRGGGEAYLGPGTSGMDNDDLMIESQDYSQEWTSQPLQNQSSSPANKNVPISGLAAAVLKSRGHMQLARSLKNSGPSVLTKSSCDLIRQAFQLLHMHGLGIANDSIFQKLHPSEVSEEMLVPFGVSLHQYAEAYAKPLNRQAALYFERLLMRGNETKKGRRPSHSAMDLSQAPVEGNLSFDTSTDETHNAYT